MRRLKSYAVIPAFLVLFMVQGKAHAQWNTGPDGSVGLGTTTPDQRVVVQGEHHNTTFKMQALGTWGNAYLNLWASEPGRTLSGAGIGNNIAGNPYFGRIAANRGASYIRLLDSEMQFYTINGSGDQLLHMAMSNGNVGIGTTTPAARLDVRGLDASVSLSLGSSANVNYTNAVWYSDTGNAQVWKSGSAYTAWGGPKALNIFTSDGSIAFHPKGSTNLMYLSETGNVGIGTTNPASKLHVDGDLTAIHLNGILNATYQDIAEWVPASKPISAGTVVIVDAEIDNQVLPSSTAYDTRVAGVVSDSPGVLLGMTGDGKVKVATTGRVKVKVDANRSPIAKGDLLVTSDKEGVAMKSEPIEFAGRRIHQPGTLIGKALQSLEEGEGEILVLLSLQ